jgi:hypothetical protein
MKTSTVITAIYQSTSVFNVDFDLQRVHKYWIKWDTLYVVHRAGEDPLEYKPMSSAEDDHECYKEPMEIVVE